MTSETPDTAKNRRRAAAGLSLVADPENETPDTGSEDQADDTPVVVTTESVVTPGSDNAKPEEPPTVAERIAGEVFALANLVIALTTGKDKVTQGTAVQLINTKINLDLAITQIRQQAQQGFGSLTSQEDPTDGEDAPNA